MRIMYRLIMREPLRVNLQQISRKFYGKLHSREREAVLVKLVAILSPLVIVGGTVTYAKYDKEFRHKLTRNIPGAESFIKVVLQEEKKPALVSISKPISKFDGISKSIDGFTASVTNFFSVGKWRASPAVNTAAVQSRGSEAAPNAKTLTKSTITQTDDKSALELKTAVALPNSILELEKAVEVATCLAIKEFTKAIDILKSFNADVFKAVDKAVEHVDPSHWHVLKNKSIARDFSVQTAESLAKEALALIAQCELALTKATTARNHNQVIAIRHKIKKQIGKINKVKHELDVSKDLASASEKYWGSVKKARNYFIEEIESIFPGLNLAEKQLNLSKEDLDLFITHAYSHVLAYQKELLRLQTEGEQRLKHAIKALRKDTDTDAIKLQVEYLLEAEKRKIAIENQKKIVQTRAETERKLLEQLRKQAEAHIDYLTEAIAFKESELKRDFQRELEIKLAKEKTNYQHEMSALVAKMRGMHRALLSRAETERSAHQSQALWAACQALWAIVRAGEQGVVQCKRKLRPLQCEVEAIAKVAADDELVAVILQSMPHEAGERGIYAEDALRDRFMNVERVARRVALVPADGGTLPAHLFSYIQSILVARPREVISQAELQDADFDFSALDTYDILNRARYFVERGDLLNALRYMNLLKGAPRIVARDWLKETRVLLETKQAANTLMAHAAANGVMFL